jgi:hypothetical protein
MNERRRARRSPFQIPLQTICEDGKTHVAMTENVSETGIAFGTPHRFEIGQRVQIAGIAAPAPVSARVVRAEKNEQAETLLWRFRVAVVLESVAPAWLLATPAR